MQLYRFTGGNRLFYITEFGHSRLAEKKRVGTRIRTDSLLHLVLSGSCTFCEGEAAAGHAFFIPQGVPHDFTAPAGYEHYWIGFGGEQLPAILSILGIPELPQIYEVGEYETLKALWSGVFAHCTEDAAGEKRVRALLLSVLSLLEKTGEAEKTALASGNGYCEKAVRFMKQTLYRPLRMEEIAAYLSISEKHFSRIFKKAYGVPPKTYMLRLRMDTAKTLLCETELRISEVAASVGYESPLEFSRMFTRYTGIPPRDFRAKQTKTGVPHA